MFSFDDYLTMTSVVNTHVFIISTYSSKQPSVAHFVGYKNVEANSYNIYIIHMLINVII